MLVPHQTSTYCCRPINWDLHDPSLSPVVEIYSHWGSDEYFGNPLQCREVDVNPHCFVDVALKRGHRMGFIGSTDEHGGAPGDGVTFLNPLGAGLACVWAPELSRESIFDALRDRWCYATTGARIVLKFTVNGLEEEALRVNVYTIFVRPFSNTDEGDTDTVTEGTTASSFVIVPVTADGLPTVYPVPDVTVRTTV